MTVPLDQLSLTHCSQLDHVSNTAIVVDSACDLPAELLRKRGIFVLPIGFQIGAQHFRDRRLPEMNAAFNNRADVRADATVLTAPTSVDTIRNFIATNIADEFENLLMLCISSTRSKIYENAVEAVRQLPGVFSGDTLHYSPRLKNVEVVDTRSVFSGQALLAYLASIAPSGDPGVAVEDLADFIKKQISSVCTYVIPNDLAYLKNRGKLRNEKSIRSVDYFIAETFGLRPIIKWQHGESRKIAICKGYDRAFGKLVQIVSEAIESELKFNTIIVSYSGDLERIKSASPYRALVEYTKARNIKCILSTMSITATVYLGPGAVSLSFCH